MAIAVSPIGMRKVTLRGRCCAAHASWICRRPDAGLALKAFIEAAADVFPQVGQEKASYAVSELTGESRLCQ